MNCYGKTGDALKKCTEGETDKSYKKYNTVNVATKALIILGAGLLFLGATLAIKAKALMSNPLTAGIAAGLYAWSSSLFAKARICGGLVAAAGVYFVATGQAALGAATAGFGGMIIAGSYMDAFALVQKGAILLALSQFISWQSMTLKKSSAPIEEGLKSSEAYQYSQKK
jgi:hypothetical protein